MIPKLGELRDLGELGIQGKLEEVGIQGKRD